MTEEEQPETNCMNRHELRSCSEYCFVVNMLFSFYLTTLIIELDRRNIYENDSKVHGFCWQKRDNYLNNSILLFWSSETSYFKNKFCIFKYANNPFKRSLHGTALYCTCTVLWNHRPISHSCYHTYNHRSYLSIYTALVKLHQCVTLVQPMVERLRNRPLVYISDL